MRVVTALFLTRAGIVTQGELKWASPKIGFKNLGENSRIK